MRHLLFSSFFLVLLTACKNENPRDSNPVQSVDSNNNQTLPESVVNTKPEVLPTGLCLKDFKFSEESCDLTIPEGVDVMEDWCNKREVNGLRVSLKNNKIASKINAQICKAITGKGGDQQTIKKFVQSIKTQNYEEGDIEFFQDEYNCKLMDSSLNYLSIQLSTYSYSMGAAHGISGVQMLNFDLHTGEKIKLSDVFVDNYRKDLIGFAKKRFMEQNGSQGWWFESGEQAFDLPSEFIITRKGIDFCYQAYEIGPYAAGLPRLKMKKEELAKWLKKNPYIKP